MTEPDPNPTETRAERIKRLTRELELMTRHYIPLPRWWIIRARRVGIKLPKPYDH